jgi:hypothetical protein
LPEPQIHQIRIEEQHWYAFPICCIKRTIAGVKFFAGNDLTLESSQNEVTVCEDEKISPHLRWRLEGNMNFA